MYCQTIISSCLVPEEPKRLALQSSGSYCLATVPFSCVFYSLQRSSLVMVNLPPSASLA